jgi:cyclopropane fatty-acyl-phospholipid synthase-like methyltransferase
MLDCTTEKYDDLYERWLDKPGELLDWAKYDPKKHRLLDLCGGTGAVSKAALARGAERVWLLDLNPRAKDKRIESIVGRAEDLSASSPFNPLADDECRYPYNWLPDARSDRWSLVVCRQALGYLNLPRVAVRLRTVMAPRGRFVFNTFVRPKWSFKTYRRTSSDWTRRYYEASAYLGRRVVHLQGRVGAGLDVTSFRWWTERDILEAFRQGWSVADFKATPTSLWFSFECL